MSAIIEFQNVHFQYPDDDQETLKGIDLRIEEGSFVAVLGHNGSGKSTLAKHMNAILTPTAGTVYVGGVDTADESRVLEVRGTVGMVFQNPDNQIVANVVEDDVAFAPENLGVPPEEIRERVDSALKTVGMYELRMHAPHLLSGGQKQRVAIARALATKPKYLLCDEATSALDPTTTRAILELLREINETLGVTIIVITHEMKVIDQICDRVAVIDHSRIAEEGKVSEVFTNPRSQIARDLIIPRERTVLETEGGKRLRLTFDGETTAGPHIAEMILSCQAPVSILQASTKELDGVIYGYTIIELPKDAHQAEKILIWLQNSGIRWKEVE